MGGRGSRFRDISPQSSKEDDFITDYGDANVDVEISKHNQLTKNLKNYNIITCNSLKNMNEDVVMENISQINNLSEKYSNLIADNLNDEAIKIRSYKMNRISLKTNKKSADYKTLALFTPIKKQICFNERVLRTREEIKSIIQDSQKNGYSVKTDKGKESQHVITHEYGHFIEQCIIEKRLQNDVREWAKFKTCSTSEMLNTRKKEAESIKNEIKQIAAQKYKARINQLTTSKYGEKDDNPFEWFAEVFAETNLHTTNKPLIKAMKTFLIDQGEVL